MNIMDRLAAARPDWLDPSEPDPARRYRDLESALSQSAEHVRSSRRSRRRIRRAWGYPLGGLVAAGTAVALAVITTSGGGAVRKPESKGLGSGRGIVLAAAEKAEQQPLGAYWYTDQVEAAAFRVPAKTGDYAIAGAANEFFEWTAVAQHGGNLFYGRDLPARPLTPADEEAWRRAGSPTSFRVWASDHYDTFTTKMGAWEADVPQAMEGGRFPFTGFNQGHMVPTKCPMAGQSGCFKAEGFGATIDQLMSLPTDPASLTARYLTYVGRPKYPTASVRPPKRPSAEQILFAVDHDLQNAPVPPKLRAGLIRMLATMPGVHQITSVTDALGRSGFAFTAVRPSAGGPGGVQRDDTEEIQLIFSPDGSYLGSQTVLIRPGGDYRDMKPGSVINYWLVRSSGWTNAKPTPPN